MTYLWIIIAIVVVAAIGLTLYLVPRRGRGAVPPVTRPSVQPGPGVAEEARETPGAGVGTLAPPPAEAEQAPAEAQP